MSTGYEQKLAELEEDVRRKTHWALDTEARLTAELTTLGDQLVKTVALLDTAETTVIERTLWAQNLQARLDLVEAQLRMVRESRWVKLGRRVGVGPRVEG